jgi:hypothetical protein
LWPRFFALRRFALFISVDRDHFSTMTILDGSDIDTAERLSEVATILAAGLMRLEGRKSSGLSSQNGESPLHFMPDQSGHANPVSPEVTA